ncbi:MAG: protein-glutamate O-methyltransferase family protein [Anaerolineae bacterium]|nr:protein-glutamate O-methyltransferase family protein [Anaerolineae bacterium]
MIARPLPIRTDLSNPFAHHTMQVRVPAIIHEVSRQNPDYPASVQTGLIELAEAMAADAPLPTLQRWHYGAADWLQALKARRGETWLNTEWFFAETYLYRHLLELVGWWHTARDPFAPKKHEELHSAALWETLDAALDVLEDDRLPADEKLATLLQLNLWGNRIDLSYALAASHGSVGTETDLLVNEAEAIIRHLLSLDAENVTLDLILDNAGTELATDLVLVDALLQHGFGRIRLHLKFHPTFVSDTTQYDFITFLTRLGFDPVEARQQLSGRLANAWDQGRLELYPDIFWNSHHFMWELAPDTSLARLLGTSSLVIFKGDANYRRLVGDAVWDTAIPFTEVLRYFPVPLAALRTMKSDPVVGLSEGLAAELDSIDAHWRVNGKRGVIQFMKPKVSDLHT